MKIAMFHYHLNAGGVTRVIENHLNALDAVCDEAVEVLIVIGDGDNALSQNLAEKLKRVRYTIHHLPSLSYDGSLEPYDLANSVEDVLKQHDFCADDVMHVHNHALGKNVAWPQALWILAERGYRFLMQVHDFIEDFRPQNFHKLRGNYANSSDEEFIKYLYPQAQAIHYCVLNNRDQSIFSDAGLPIDRLRILPNPVFGEVIDKSIEESKQHWAQCMGVAVPERLIVYPVRGITRKNVGELLLHASLAQAGEVYAITLPPANPVEAAHLERWQNLSEELELPCHFGVGTVDGLGFEENVAAADAIMTTSVAEGFGMVFLEPWLMGKAVIGRDLPEITEDFKANGVQYRGLYKQLPIPLSWVGEAAYAKQWSHSYAYALRSYGMNSPGSEGLAQRALEQVDNETIDFALLTVDLQRQIVRAVAKDGAKQAWLRDSLEGQLSIVDNEEIEKNAQIIKRYYSFDCIGQQLMAGYQSLLQERTAAEFSTLNQPHAVLNGFLDAKRFFPLRVGD